MPKQPYDLRRPLKRIQHHRDPPISLFPQVRDRLYTTPCQILIPNFALTDDMERSSDAFGRDVDVTMGREGCGGYEEEFLFCDPGE